MRKNVIFGVVVCFMAVVGMGCAHGVTDERYLAVAHTSDFIPAKGRPERVIPHTAGERRLLTATSTDGIRFTPTGKILTDQGNVPDVIVDAEGVLHVYYVGQSLDNGKEEGTALARSSDGGVTWEFLHLRFENFPEPRDPADPDVVLLENGTYRMYFTASLSGGSIGILYAESSDGITFTYKGEALRTTKNIVDSTTFFFNGMWHMYVLQERGDGQLHATSSDGLTFSLAPNPNVRLASPDYVLSNSLQEKDKIRMFGFSLFAKNIRTFTSTDGERWVADEVALTGDATEYLGSSYIQDSSVVKLPDGTFFMVYVSEIPK